MVCDPAIVWMESCKIICTKSAWWAFVKGIIVQIKYLLAHSWKWNANVLQAAEGADKQLDIGK